MVAPPVAALPHDERGLEGDHRRAVVRRADFAPPGGNHSPRSCDRSCRQCGTRGHSVPCAPDWALLRYVRLRRSTGSREEARDG